VVKAGPQAFKSVSLLEFGEPDSDEITKRELRVQSWTARDTGTGIDFTKADHSWHCENQEIDKFLAFLSGEVTEPGRYRRIRSGAANEIVDAIENGSADPSDLEAVVTALVAKPESVTELASSEPGERLASAVRTVRHGKTLDQLEVLLEDQATTEPQIQGVLENDWWIFGGRFIDRASRRSLTVLDQIDVPLIRADGTLHVVELKAANVPRLVVSHRNHYVVGPEVNLAVGQVMNYLRSLDEQRDVVLNNLGVDCRRAFATVVIGDPRWVADISESDINATIRTYNSHLSRIEVITFADLISDSRRAVDLQERMA
jgi:hypothetical protein